MTVDLTTHLFPPNSTFLAGNDCSLTGLTGTSLRLFADGMVNENDRGSAILQLYLLTQGLKGLFVRKWQLGLLFLECPR